jgi:hypothetical protein
MEGKDYGRGARFRAVGSAMGAPRCRDEPEAKRRKTSLWAPIGQFYGGRVPAGSKRFLTVPS